MESIKSLVPNKSVSKVGNIVATSLTQTNHSLFSDFIAIICIVIFLFCIMFLINYFKLTSKTGPELKIGKQYIIEGNQSMSTRKLALKKLRKNKCSSGNVEQLCKNVKEQGKNECIQYPCCNWIDLKDKKGKIKDSLCVKGSVTGPNMIKPNMKFDEFYYMNKKYKNKNVNSRYSK